MSGQVLRTSASGLLKPIGTGHAGRQRQGSSSVDDNDPIMAVLNKNWKMKKDTSADAGDDDHKHARGKRRNFLGGGDHDDCTTPGLRSTEKKMGASSSTGAVGANAGPRSRLGLKDLSVDPTSSFGCGGEALSPKTHNHYDRSAGLGPGSPGHFGSSPTKEVAAPARRKYGLVIEEKQADESPKWNKGVGKAGCRLNYIEQAPDDPTKEKPKQTEAEQAAERFILLSEKLQNWVGQANMQMNNMLTTIRNRHQEDKSVLEIEQNLERLKDMVFDVLTCNYHIGKWLHQLDPKKYPVPNKPLPPTKEETATDMLSQVQFALSKMDSYGGELGPMLLKICHDAKTMRRTPDGRPVTPSSKNASTLAQKRGIVDPDELQPLVGHLEHLLELAQAVAHKPVASKAMKSTIQVLLAVNRFKKKGGGLFGKKAAGGGGGMLGAVKAAAS